MDQIVQQVSTIATSAAMNSWSLASSFLVLIILTVVFIIISYRSHSGMIIISLLVSFYVGYGLYLVFPYTSSIVGAGGSPIMKAIISISIYAIACVVPFIFVNRLTQGGVGLLSVFPRFGLSFLGAAFLMALAYHVFPISHIYTFPEPMNTIFAPDQYFFWWFIAPLIGLLLLVH